MIKPAWGTASQICFCPVKRKSSLCFECGTHRGLQDLETQMEWKRRFAYKIGTCATEMIHASVWEEMFLSLSKYFKEMDFLSLKNGFSGCHFRFTAHSLWGHFSVEMFKGLSCKLRNEILEKHLQAVKKL